MDQELQNPFISARRLDAYHRGAIAPLASSLAEPETSPAATAHAVGDLVVYNYRLYKVTSPILIGDALTVGSNITATTAAEEMGSGGGGGSSEVDARLDSCEQNILAIYVALALENGEETEGMTDNVAIETFMDTSGYTIASGLYDSTNHRVYA